jgi:Uncharacterised nucleotidyltransferase
MPPALTIRELASALCHPRNAQLRTAVEWPSLLADAEAHGIVPLLADAAAVGGWDSAVVALIRPAHAAHAAVSIVRERELRLVLDALDGHHVRPILFKGAHLAFTIYPSPDRRPHVDADLLVARDDLERVDRCLGDLGYELVPQVTGDVAFGQQQYWKIDTSGAGHTIDVHWRIANPRAFGDRLTYSDLARGATPVPRLGAHARGPSPPLALLVACLHRTAHHGTSHRLIWLYDIHLLASALAADEWHELVDLAAKRDLSAVLAAGLEHASAYFETPVPASVLEELRAASPADPDLLAFLDGPRPRFGVAASDWRRIHRWRDRSRFLREHLFPPARYMAHRYGTTSPAVLPLLYIRRILTGAGKWAVESWARK